jgi:hypothetical protein
MLEGKKQLFLTRRDYRSITFRVMFGIYDLFRGRARPRAGDRSDRSDRTARAVLSMCARCLTQRCMVTELAAGRQCFNSPPWATDCAIWSGGSARHRLREIHERHTGTHKGQ